jgi:hypothetical protein
MSRLPLPLPAVFRRCNAPAEPNQPDPARCAEPDPVRRRRRAVRVIAHVVTVLLMLSVPAAAYADTGVVEFLAADAPKNLQTVIGNLQTWIMGILAALATLFLVLAGVYWATAGGDPAQVDKAKQALKNALVGYGLAVLAPVLLEIVKGIVGG